MRHPSLVDLWPLGWGSRALASSGTRSKVYSQSARGVVTCAGDRSMCKTRLFLSAAMHFGACIIKSVRACEICTLRACTNTHSVCIVRLAAPVAMGSRPAVVFAKGADDELPLLRLMRISLWVRRAYWFYRLGTPLCMIYAPERGGDWQAKFGCFSVYRFHIPNHKFSSALNTRNNFV